MKIVAICLLAFGSPFAMAKSEGPMRYRISDFGAVADGKTIHTTAIQNAIDQAAAKGGGVVVIPAGTFRSGSIFLKPGVELELTENAVLLGSTNIEDYPKRETRIEGLFEPWRMALVNAQQMDGVRISGKGVIDGNGITFWAQFWQRRRENPKCTNLEVERPRLMFIDRCSDVRITGVSLRYSGFWNLHPYRCNSVVVDGLTITSPTRHTKHRNYMTDSILKGMKNDSLVKNAPIKDNILGPSTDGIDIDSSQKVIIRNCYISADDNIALKGSKGPLADQDKDCPPVEEILVENCEFGDGNGMITCGSEATVIRNVTVKNCRITGDATLLTLKLRPDTPQHYENILIEGITLEGGQGRMLIVAPWKQFFDLKGHAPPSRTVNHITLRDIRGEFATLGSLGGNPGDTLRDITFENIALKLADPHLKLGDVKNFIIRNVEVNGIPYQVPPSKGP